MTRPLRWPKFVLVSGLAIPLAAGSGRALRPLADLARTSHVDHPAGFWLPALVFALSASCAVWAILDVSFDLRVPKVAVCLLVVLATARWEIREREVEGVASWRGEEQMRWAAARLGLLAVESLRRGVQPGEIELSRELRAGLPSTSFRSRGILRVPPRVRILYRHAPQMEPLRGDGPGTLYLALAEGGGAGWITAVGIGNGGPGMVREGGRAMVIPVSAALRREEIAYVGK